MVDKSVKVKLISNIKWSGVPEYLIDEVIELMQIKLPIDDSTSTKQCPKCGNTKLLLLQTFNKKICTDCNTEIPWHLTANQKPLF